MAHHKQLLRSATCLLPSAPRSSLRTASPISVCVRQLSKTPRRREQKKPAEEDDWKPVRLLSDVDYKGKALPPKPDPKKDPWGGLWYPRTRMAAVIVLICVIFYDMVSRDTTTQICSVLTLYPAHELPRPRTSRSASGGSITSRPR